MRDLLTADLPAHDRVCVAIGELACCLGTHTDWHYWEPGSSGGPDASSAGQADPFGPGRTDDRRHGTLGRIIYASNMAADDQQRPAQTGTQGL